MRSARATPPNLFAARSADHGLRTEIVSIDPAPRAGVDDLCDEVIRTAFENVPEETYSELLQAGDMVFMDNSHRCFQNSDVTVFFTEVLPVLPSGVIYGLHDIFLPDDYPVEWESRFYNEQYMLVTYLLGGASHDEIVCPGMFMSHDLQSRQALGPCSMKTISALSSAMREAFGWRGSTRSERRGRADMTGSQYCPHIVPRNRRPRLRYPAWSVSSAAVGTFSAAPTTSSVVVAVLLIPLLARVPVMFRDAIPIDGQEPDPATVRQLSEIFGLTADPVNALRIRRMFRRQAQYGNAQVRIESAQFLDRVRSGGHEITDAKDHSRSDRGAG